jgi:hypothetical protein
MEFITKKSLHYEFDENLEFKDDNGEIYFQYQLQLTYKEIYDIVKLSSKLATIDKLEVEKQVEMAEQWNKDMMVMLFKKDAKDVKDKLGAECELYVYEIVGELAKKYQSKQDRVLSTNTLSKKIGKK